METESLKTQVKMLKWIFGGMMAAFLLVGVSLGTVIYAHGTAISKTKQLVTSQTAIVTDNKNRTLKNSEKLNDFSGRQKENGVHLVHIRGDIKDMKQMMDAFYNRK